MKWYYMGFLSLLVCTLSGLLGWLVGGLENSPFWVGFVGFLAIMCHTQFFTRKFPVFYSNAGYIVLYLLAGGIYAAAVLINFERHVALGIEQAKQVGGL